MGRQCLAHRDQHCAWRLSAQRRALWWLRVVQGQSRVAPARLDQRRPGPPAGAGERQGLVEGNRQQRPGMAGRQRGLFGPAAEPRGRAARRHAVRVPHTRRTASRREGRRSVHDRRCQGAVAMTDQRGQHDPTAFYDMDDTSALPLATVNDLPKPSSWRQFWTSAQYAAANGEEGADEARRQSVIDDSLSKVVAQLNHLGITDSRYSHRSAREAWALSYNEDAIWEGIARARALDKNAFRSEERRVGKEWGSRVDLGGRRI